MSNGPTPLLPSASVQLEAAWAGDADLKEKAAKSTARSTWLSTIVMSYSALGVIYGDIGTSPLYTIDSIFATFTPGEEDILQAMSLIFWTITLVVTIKYVLIVLHANDHGEGGTFALYSHLCRTIGVSPFGTLQKAERQQLLAISRKPSLARGGIVERNQSAGTPGYIPGPDAPQRWWNFLALDDRRARRWFRSHVSTQRVLLVVSIIATSLVFGDGVLTPAVSVVSAVSGLEVASTNVTPDVVTGVSCGILVILFLVQSNGTKTISLAFSPIVLLWLLSNAAIGCFNLATFGAGAFKGLNPYYIYDFFQQHGTDGWRMLAAVMLCITGAEAMFADLGHFNITSVSISWCLIAYPCLILTYLGQGSYLISNPDAIGSTYWSSVPTAVFWPMLVLATAATVVASQALISACFSMARQAMRLGVFPKMKVVHTDKDHEGQIYIAGVNYVLLGLTIAAVAGFKADSVTLGNAYGLTISVVMLITTCLVTLVMVLHWRISLLLVVPFVCGFGFIEGAFVSANLTKIPHGGWFALLIAGLVAAIDLIWWAGQDRRRSAMARYNRLQTHEVFTIIPSSKLHSLRTTRRRSLTRHTFASGMYHAHSALTSPFDSGAAGAHPGRASGLGSAFLNAPAAAQAAGARPVVEGLQYSSPPGADVSSSVTPLSGTSSIAEPEVWLPAGPIAEGTTSAGDDAARPGGDAYAAAAAAVAAAAAGPADHPLTPGMPPGNGASEPRSAVRFTELAVPGSQASKQGSWKEHGLLSPSKGHPANAGSQAAPRGLAALSRPVGGGGYEIALLKGDAALALMTSPDQAVVRLPGIGLYYAEDPNGLPSVLRHFMQNVEAVHQVNLFVHVRFLPIPFVDPDDRLLVRSMPGLPDFYQAVARYGYQDVVDHGRDFVNSLLAKIVHRLEDKLGVGHVDDVISGLENDPGSGPASEAVGGPADDEDDERVATLMAQQSLQTADLRRRAAAAGSAGDAVPPEIQVQGADGRSSVPSLQVPHEPPRMSVDLNRLSREVSKRVVHLAPSRPRAATLLPGGIIATGADYMQRLSVVAEAELADGSVTQSQLEEVSLRVGLLLDAASNGVVYYFGRTNLRMTPGSSFAATMLYERLYRPMLVTAHADNEAWSVPVNNLVELGMVVHVQGRRLAGRLWAMAKANGLMCYFPLSWSG